MIVAERKPFEEIETFIKNDQKILTVGCAGCVTVCLAGGEKEVGVLNAELAMSAREQGRSAEFDGITVQRQCDMEFLAELDDRVAQYDAIISLACGAGIQFMAERFPDKPVFPGVNTNFIGVNRDVGWYEEKCRACGNCQLGLTGGICPVTMCAKSLFNGPCGGTNDESCEVSKDQPCAWFMIHQRLKAQNRLDNILMINPINDWRNIKPQTLIQPGYRERKAFFEEG